MSNGYGIDIYGTVTYGYSQPVDFSVAPFIAKQTDYNRISLMWTSPNQTSFWKQMLLVRSPYGYPSTPADGTTVLTVTSTTLRNNYDDIGLLPGRIYYYTMFIGKDVAAYNAGTTYNAGDVVAYGANLYWVSIAGSNTGHTPAAGSAFWHNVAYTPTWAPAGYAASLAANDYGYGDTLYNRVPQPYKVTVTDVFSDQSQDNEELRQYLNVMGWGLDIIRTEYDSYLQLNNPDTVAASNLDLLGKQLGVSTDYLASPQSRRQRVKNLSVNYRLKGTQTSIHNAVAAITGWDSVVTPSNNLMLGSDQAQFGHPSLDKWSANTVYQVGAAIQYNGYNYSCLVQAYGTAQKPTGAATSNTWWQVKVSTTTTPLLDAGQALKNPKAYTALEPSFSTWQNAWTQTPPIGDNILTGVYTGLPHPTIAGVNNWNALGYKNTVGGATVYKPTMFSVNRVAVSAWSNATNYVINNYVSNSGINYIALKPSGPGTVYGFITPGTNVNFWKAVVLDYQYTIGSQPYDATNFELDSTPVTTHQAWNSTTTYAVGDQVDYNGIIYQAVMKSLNDKPSGYYYSSDAWIYLQPAEYVFTLSAYQARLTTSATAVTSFTEVGYFYEDPRGVADFPGINPQSINNLLARFDGDYTDLNGVNDNTLSTTVNPWVASPSTANLWYSSYGMAAVNLSIAGTTTYNFLRMDDTLNRTFKNIYVTFGTDFVDSAHRAHGIFFRWQDNSNFWYATRKTLYKVVAGVETVMATWTRLIDGDRMAIGLNSTTKDIEVDVYARKTSTFTPPSWPFLNNVAFIPGDTTFATSSQCGLIVKYSASGAV